MIKWWWRIGLITALGCGPSWKDVVKHPDGTFEDTKTGECWREGPYGGYEPVRCPSRR
jgi:hypothetical protein